MPEVLYADPKISFSTEPGTIPLTIGHSATGTNGPAVSGLVPDSVPATCRRYSEIVVTVAPLCLLKMRFPPRRGWSGGEDVTVMPGWVPCSAWCLS